jgi:hypothetical protein
MRCARISPHYKVYMLGSYSEEGLLVAYGAAGTRNRVARSDIKIAAAAVHCASAIRQTRALIGGHIYTIQRQRCDPRLNFGDCLAYATARVAGEPLLYTGEDFALTDVAPCDVPPPNAMPNRQARNSAFRLVNKPPIDDIDEVDDPPSASRGTYDVSCCLTIT